MAHRYGWIFSLICMIFLTVLPSSFADGRHSLQYREIRGEHIRTRYFYIKPMAEGVTVSSSVENNQFLTHCDDSGNTNFWEVDKKNKQIRAVRNGNRITISGTSAGEPVNKKLNKDELPWFQSLYYSLSLFVQSDQKVIEFWMIRPDNLTLVKLRAEKEAVEKIQINDKEERAQKIRLGLTGILSYIWHGYYWYRPDDGVLLQYKDMKALPGRAKLTVRLFETEKS